MGSSRPNCASQGFDLAGQSTLLALFGEGGDIVVQEVTPGGAWMMANATIDMKARPWGGSMRRPAYDEWEHSDLLSPDPLDRSRVMPPS